MSQVLLTLDISLEEGLRLNATNLSPYSKEIDYLRYEGDFFENTNNELTEI